MDETQAVAAPRAFGPFVKAAKTASIHLARKSVFIGVHPRKAAIPLAWLGDVHAFSGGCGPDKKNPRGEPRGL